MNEQAPEQTKPREHEKTSCWCGHGADRHVDRASGIVSGDYEYQLGCLDCEANAKKTA